MAARLPPLLCRIRIGASKDDSLVDVFTVGKSLFWPPSDTFWGTIKFIDDRGLFEDEPSDCDL